MIWEPQAQPEALDHAVRLEPDRVLFQFDEPLMFTCKIGLSNYILLKVDEAEGTNRYIACFAREPALTAFLGNSLSVWGMMDEHFFGIIDATADRTISRYWNIPFSEITDEYLPERGVGIEPSQEWVPDTLEQSGAFFSVRFSGQNLTRDRMPLRLFKKLTTEFYDAVRKQLTPVWLEGRNSGVFEYGLSEPAFGSLILTIDEPKLNLQGLQKKLNDRDVDLAAVREAFIQRNRELFETLERLNAIAEAGAIGDQDADQNLEILDSLLDLFPGEGVIFETVEFSARLAGRMHYVSIGGEAGQRLRVAYERAAGRERTIVGNVGIINANSKTFVLNRDNGRQATCQMSADLFEGILADRGFSSNARVRVTGEYTQRDRRDLMQVDRLPEVLPQE